MSSVSSIFTLNTFKFYHIFIYTFTSSSTRLPLCSFLCLLPVLVRQCLFSSWVSNFSIRFFFLAIQIPCSFLLFFFFLLRFFGLQNVNLFWFLEQIFFFKAQISCRPNLEYRPVFTETPQNTWNRLKWPKIFSEME